MDASDSVVDLFADTASRHGDEPALVCDDTSISWAELASRVEDTAGWLAAHDVSPGDRVGLALANNPAFVETFLAAFTVGAVAVPLDPQLTDPELATYGRDAAVRLLVEATDDRRRDPGAVGAAVVRRDPFDAPAPGGPKPPRVRVAADDPALVGFSSGSTGRPKRVVRSHANLVAEAHAFGTTCDVTADDRILAVVPLFHAHGLGNALLASLRSGAALVIERSFARDRVMDALDARRISVFPSVPFAIRMLATSRRARTADLGALRLCFTAGGPLPPETFAEFRSCTGVPTRQLYGCTEAGALALNLDPDPATTVGSVGRPLDGVSLRIVSDNGDDAAPGHDGEIVVSSPSLADRYEDPPERSGSGFVDGWFHTGDIGHRDGDGRLYVTGRIKVYIATAGNKVDPAEVEGVMLTLDGVEEAAVVGVPAHHGTEAVKVVVVAGDSLTRAAVIAHCRDRLAEFKVPRVVEFREALPRDAMGKLRREELL